MDTKKHLESSVWAHKTLLYKQIYLFREAFQSKKRGHFGNGPNRGGGSSKNQKSPNFQLGKVQKWGGGVFGNQKSPKFQRVPKTNKIMTHFHLMRTQKHKILSIDVKKSQPR